MQDATNVENLPLQARDDLEDESISFEQSSAPSQNRLVKVSFILFFSGVVGLAAFRWMSPYKTTAVPSTSTDASVRVEGFMQKDASVNPCAPSTTTSPVNPCAPAPEVLATGTTTPPPPVTPHVPITMAAPEEHESCSTFPSKVSLPLSPNPCANSGPQAGTGFDNLDCLKDGVVQAAEQAGGNVTEGWTGQFQATTHPVTQPFWKQGLCPVNVHWHLGTEHLSQGQYDETGKVPSTLATGGHRRLSEDVRRGFACHLYNAYDPKFTTPYKWQYCHNMQVGETYEVHWPHSAVGACKTPFQFQSPFVDGVFCGWNDDVAASVAANAQNLVNAVGVQAQIFTIVNDEDYYYPNLMLGAIVDGEFWKDVTAYTGSTTGTTRDNQICSAYSPITWQVDRKCHLISASSFDKMCADMKQQPDDMSADILPHGARELVLPVLNANNQAEEV